MEKLNIENLTLPDFLVIGAQKCGTTWLDNVLRQHPQINLPKDRKEMHFFDSRYYNGKSLKWYSRFFKKDFINGEITPRYAIITSDKIQFIKECLPKVKIFYILRNPVERAWSMLNSLVDLEKMSLELIVRQLVSQPNVHRSDYATCLQSWLEHFDRTDIKILYFDNLKNDPIKLLNNFTSHLPTVQNHDWNIEALNQKIASGSIVNNYKTPAKKKGEMPKLIKQLLQEMYLPKLKALYKIESSKTIEDWIRYCEN